MVYSWDITENLCHRCVAWVSITTPAVYLLHWHGCFPRMRRQNEATECFIRTLLYSGCQRIRWKISAGHQVTQFYLGRKETGWLSRIERKLFGQNSEQPFITWPWRLSCRRQGCHDHSLSGVLKTIVQVQAQHAEDHHNNTYSKLINSPYQEAQMSNPRLFITCRKDDGRGGGGSGGEKMWVIVRCKKKKRESCIISLL